MQYNPLDFRYLYTRSRMLENAFPRKNNKNYSHLEKAIFESNKPVSKITEENYINLCESWKNILKSLEVLYKNNQYGLLESSVERIKESVIPSIRDIKNCISFIEGLDIGDINKDRLIENAKIYKSIDRIKKNHKMLTERFNIEKMYEAKGRPLRKRLFSICEAIDTYNLSPFIKINIALEESKLLDYRNKTNLDESALVESVLDYFLLRSSNTEEDIESYKRAIKESKVISNDGINNISYFMEDNNSILEEYDISSWKDKLNNWKMSVKDSPNNLMDILYESLDNSDAIYNIISTAKEFDRYNTGYSHSYTFYIENSTNDIYLSDNELKSIIEAYERLLEDYIIKEDSNMDQLYELYYTTIQENEIKYDPNKVYDGKEPKEPITFTSDDIDEFKLSGLISDAQTVGKTLDKMDESFIREYSLCRDYVHIDGPITIDNYKNFIGEDGKMYYVCRSYTISDDNIENIHELANSMYKCINSILHNTDSKAYVQLSEHVLSLGISSKYRILLSLTEEESNDIHFPESLNEYIIDINQNLYEASLLEKSHVQEIYDKLHNRIYAGDVSVEDYTMIAEALYLLGDNDTLNEFTSLCKNEVNDNYDKFIRINDKLSYDNYPAIEDTILVSETLDYLSKITKVVPLDEAFNLNNLRLAWQAFKTKAKHFSAKEKELSRDVDSTFNMLLKSLRSALNVDYRERIIRGQITPSLSKMLKIGVALAGLGLVTSNPYIPALTAVAGFALSKNISRKERALILDEIDIELQVLDREINKAESSGSAKKYRELLKIQKTLQRERQRIYYGLSTEGKKIPMPSSIGQRRLKS